MTIYLRRFGLIGPMLILLIGSLVNFSASGAASSDSVEPNAGNWKTWVLTSGNQFRPAAPPDQATSEAEISQLKDMVSKRDAAALDQIQYWDAGGPTYRWNEITVNEILKNNQGTNMSTRTKALVDVAIYDATIAVWDSKYTYNRPRPSDFDSRLTTVIPNPQSPAYPSEYAAVAAAASDVLGYLFPDDAQLFADLAKQATDSRLLAGVEYPSDVTSGLDLGHKVGGLAVAWGKADGSDAKWAGSVPTDPGKWNGTNPIAPLGGTWKTWVLTSGSEFRPGPPPAYDSDQEKADLAVLEDFEATPQQVAQANFWQFGAGAGRFVGFYNEILSRKIFEYGLDTDPPRAARVFALQSITTYDAIVATWDAKYTYWAIRPFMLDPNFKPLFATPNHPSYPAAHAVGSTATAVIVSYLFPRDADDFMAMADQAGQSRIWAGIHFPTDVTVGNTLGQQVAQKVIDYAQNDGSADGD